MWVKSASGNLLMKSLSRSSLGRLLTTFPERKIIDYLRIDGSITTLPDRKIMVLFR